MSDDDGDASRTFFTPHFFKRLRYGTLHPQTRSTGLLEIIVCTITESPQARIQKPRRGAGDSYYCVSSPTRVPQLSGVSRSVNPSSSGGCETGYRVKRIMSQRRALPPWPPRLLALGLWAAAGAVQCSKGEFMLCELRRDGGGSHDDGNLA